MSKTATTRTRNAPLGGPASAVESACPLDCPDTFGWVVTVENGEAVSLRGALRKTAERLAEGKAPDRTAVERINKALASRPAYRQLELKGNKVVSGLHTLSESARHLLVPIADSAAWLLEHGDMSLVRRCENPECVIYFYDTTKNKRRRWCSMDACGGRAKAAAYYRRSHPLK